MLGAAGRVIMSTPLSPSGAALGKESQGEASLGGKDPEDLLLRDRALGLLLDICSAASAAAGPSDWGMLRTRALPLLLTAQPGGVALAAAVRAMVLPPPSGLQLTSGSTLPHPSGAAPEPRSALKKRKAKAAAGFSSEDVAATAVPSSSSHAPGQPAEGAGAEAGVRRLWCALQLLPHACEAPSQAIAACR